MKFLVTYLAPAKGMEEWMAQPEAVRKEQQDKMQADWGVWMAANKSKLNGMTAGVGKTKRVDTSGITDVKNDMMLYTMLDAESHEAAAEIFKNHPHLGIPGGSIEVMPINPLPGMEGMQ